MWIAQTGSCWLWNWFWLVQTSSYCCWNCCSNRFLLFVEDGSDCDLFKLAVTSSNCLLLIVETSCDQFKLVHACCWNWLLKVQTGCYWLLSCEFKLVCAVCWNWLWLVQTSSCWLLKLTVISSNWLLLVVEIQAVIISNWFLLSHQLVVETVCDKFKLVRAYSWNWLWLVQTGCYWLLKYAVTSSNWLLKLVETQTVVTECASRETVTSSNCFLLIVETGCD